MAPRRGGIGAGGAARAGDDMTDLYVGTQKEMEDVAATIDANCGFPNEAADSWGTPEVSPLTSVWFIKKPPSTGYSNRGLSYSQAQMIAGLVGVAVETYATSWRISDPGIGHDVQYNPTVDGVSLRQIGKDAVK
jgi:hypothetical protein